MSPMLLSTVIITFAACFTANPTGVTFKYNDPSLASSGNFTGTTSLSFNSPTTPSAMVFPVATCTHDSFAQKFSNFTQVHKSTDCNLTERLLLVSTMFAYANPIIFSFGLHAHVNSSLHF